jgi:hypothetical protein
MIMRRRRPLLRAARVGGTAYYAGKRRQENQQQDDMTEARLQELEAQRYAAPTSAPAASGMSSASIEQLKELAQLKNDGILTEDEFEQQKRRLLQGS